MSTETSTPKRTTLASFILTENGKIDIDASVEAFRSYVEEQNKGRKQQNENVGSYVNAVFDQLKGATNFDHLTSQVALLLASNGHPVAAEEHTALKKAVHNYVSANKGEKDSGQMFRVAVGKGVGGITRWSDLTA